MPRCSACEIRKETIAQQASVIEALTRALDAVRPAAASLPAVSYGSMPQDDEMVTSHEIPDEVRKAIVTVGGYEGPLREHLEQWAETALVFGMPEAEVARRIFEGDND